MPSVIIEDRTKRPRATKDEHIARMAQAETMLRVQGWAAVDVQRHLAREHNITHRQARRYVTAVRSIYAAAALDQPVVTREEWIALLMADHARCVAGEAPDFRAAQKLLETIARANGWHAPRVVKVDATVTHTHTHEAINRLSPDEQAALAAYHEARARRELAGAVDVSPAVVETAGSSSED